MNRFLIKIFFISFYFVNSQEIPNDFLLFIKQKINFDSRKNWKNLTTLGSPRYQDFKIDKNYKKDSLYIKTRYGLFKKGNNIALYGYGNFIYQEYLYGYLYPRIVKGGILILDDYGTFPGETKAVDEYFKDKDIKIKKFPFAATPSFIIK